MYKDKYRKLYLQSDHATCSPFAIWFSIMKQDAFSQNPNPRYCPPFSPNFTINTSSKVEASLEKCRSINVKSHLDSMLYYSLAKYLLWNETKWWNKVNGVSVLSMVKVATETFSSPLKQKMKILWMVKLLSYSFVEVSRFGIVTLFYNILSFILLYIIFNIVVYSFYTEHFHFCMLMY